MDPDQCLEEILELASKFIEDSYSDKEDANQLAYKVICLHDWIRGGGFIPEQWRVYKNARS